MTVLVLTAHDDDTATRVCRALEARGHDHVRMDLGDFPEKLSFTASGPGPPWVGRLSDGQRDLPLTDIEAVYWRRPTSFRLPAHLNEQQRRFAMAETRQGLGGLISCLPVPFVNHPSRVADAELKPAQLQAAAEIGVMVPPTLITSSGSEARQFANRFGKVLYKPLTSAFLREDDQVKLVYATLVDASDIDDASIALSPCQFQAFIPKSLDIRLVAVGQECFAVGIHAGSDKSYVDWRADYPSLSYEAIETPALSPRPWLLTSSGSGWRSDVSTSRYQPTSSNGSFWNAAPTPNGDGWSTRPGCRSPMLSLASSPGVLYDR